VKGTTYTIDMKGTIHERIYTRKEPYLHEECRDEESVRELVDWWGQAKIIQKQPGFRTLDLDVYCRENLLKS
jgi:hypothetical protein